MEAFLKSLREYRYDDIVSTIEYIKKLTSGTINVKCEKAEDEKRIILTNIRTTNNLSNKLNQICNGLVLLYPTFEVLSIPTPTLLTQYKQSEIDPQTYDVYPIKDGTIVTLYHYDGDWKISSAHGYEVNNYTWLSTYSYEAVIYELLDSIGHARQKLDPKVCYNIGFTHKEFHPASIANEIWLVGATNRTTYEDVFAEAAKLIPPQRKLETVAPLDVLIKTNYNARRMYQITGKRHYGYVLRSSFEKNGRNANIMLESSLMKYIRNVFYQFPKRIVFKDAAERKLYINMRTYLDIPNLNDVKSLVPTITSVHHDLDEKLKPLIFNIVKRLRNKNGKYSDVKGIKKNVLEYFVEDITARKDLINIGGRDQYGIVESYIKNVRNIDALLIYISDD